MKPPLFSTTKKERESKNGFIPNTFKENKDLRVNEKQNNKVKRAQKKVKQPPKAKPSLVSELKKESGVKNGPKSKLAKKNIELKVNQEQQKEIKDTGNTTSAISTTIKNITL
jgi:hypothetical protein